MPIQKGPKPESIKNANYPLMTNEVQHQKETANPYGFKVNLGPTMPTIELQTKQSGKIGSASPVTVKPLAEAFDVKPANPEQNFHDQFVKPNEIQPDDRKR